MLFLKGEKKWKQFYVLIVKTYDNGTTDKTSITYGALDEAIAVAHTQWGQKCQSCNYCQNHGSNKQLQEKYPLHTLYWESLSLHKATEETE